MFDICFSFFLSPKHHSNNFTAWLLLGQRLWLNLPNQIKLCYCISTCLKILSCSLRICLFYTSLFCFKNSIFRSSHLPSFVYFHLKRKLFCVFYLLLNLKIHLFLCFRIVTSYKNSIHMSQLKQIFLNQIFEKNEKGLLLLSRKSFQMNIQMRCISKKAKYPTSILVCLIEH